MKFDDSKLNGNVSAKGLQDFIEIHAFDFSVVRKMNTHPGVTADREGTKPSISEVVVTKRVDQTTPILFQEATTGSALASAEIKFVNTGKDLSEYLTITLSNVILSRYELMDEVILGETENNTHKDKPIEKIALNFDKIEVKFTPYDESHSAQSPVSAGYDLKTAAAA
tara:strand:+ start:856 stop:1359 length:504 start_codon:yes stop_codon:yes gene_type:complete